MVHSGKKDSASASASGGSSLSSSSSLGSTGLPWCTPKPDVDDFANQVLRQRLGTLLLQMGWQSAHNSSLNVLVDLAGRYLRDLGSHCQRQAELSNRCQVNALDVARTLADFRIQTSDLAEYADCLPRGSGVAASGIPAFPKPSTTQLNFLKPGSREVLRRKVYVNDYFPPMFPNLEEEEDEVHERDSATLDTDTPTPSGDNTGQAGGPGPESLPVREIASVMMTSAGFISPAREGKLPESRTPYVHEMVRERETEAQKASQMEGKAQIKAKMKAKNAGSMDKKLKVFQKKAPKSQATHNPSDSSPMNTHENTSDHHIDDTINAVIQRGLKDSSKPPKPLPESPPKRGRPPKRKVSECIPEPQADLSEGEIVEPEVEVPPPKPKKAKIPKNTANSSASTTPASSKKTANTPRKLAGVDDEPIKTPPTPEILREKEALRNAMAKATNADTPTPPPTLPSKSPEPEKIRKKEKKKKAKKDKKESRGEKRDKSKKAEKREKGKEKSSKSITKLKIKDTPTVSVSSPEPPVPPISSVSVSVSNTPTTSKPAKKSKTDSSKKIPELKLFLPTATIKKNPVEPIKTNITLPVAPPEPPAKITVPIPPPKKEKIVKRRKSTKAPPAPSSTPSSSITVSTAKPTPTVPSRGAAPNNKPVTIDGNAGGSITTRTVGHYVDADGNQIWICPACGKQDDGSPMIGCDECDDWYHWLCVGISSEPDESQNWFCQRCVARKRGPML